MKILKILLYIVLGLAGLVALLGLLAKKDYVIERTIEIKSPKSIVIEQVTDYRNFKKWSPWEGLDPKIVINFSGEQGKVGSAYHWKGNDQVGVGSMTLTNLTDSRADMELKFIEPFESVAPNYYTFDEKDGITKVLWGIKMHMPFPMNVSGMFMDMDKALGDDYSKGLVKLKKVCEELAAVKKYKGYEVTESELPVRYYSGIRSVVKFADLHDFFQKNMPKSAELTAKQGAKIDGPATGLYWYYDEKKGQTDMATAVPISEAQKLGNGVTVFTVGGGKAATINYFGNYEKIGDAHMAMDEFMTEKGLEQIPPVIEEYVTDPMVEKDTSKWLSRVIYFTKPKASAVEELKK